MGQFMLNCPVIHSVLSLVLLVIPIRDDASILSVMRKIHLEVVFSPRNALDAPTSLPELFLFSFVLVTVSDSQNLLDMIAVTRFVLLTTEIRVEAPLQKPSLVIELTEAAEAVAVIAEPTEIMIIHAINAAKYDGSFSLLSSPCRLRFGCNCFTVCQTYFDNIMTKHMSIYKHMILNKILKIYLQNL